MSLGRLIYRALHGADGGDRHGPYVVRRGIKYRPECVREAPSSLLVARRVIDRAAALAAESPVQMSKGDLDMLSALLGRSIRDIREGRCPLTELDVPGDAPYSEDIADGLVP